MDLHRKGLPVLLVIFMICFPYFTMGSKVVKCLDGNDSLIEKWDKTLKKASKESGDFWLAYSIERSVRENTYFLSTYRITGSISFSSGAKGLMGTKEPLLGELLYGKEIDFPVNEKSGDEQVKDAARVALEGIKNPGVKRVFKKVRREIAILFLFKKGVDGPVKVRCSDMFFPFNSMGKPVYWLGKRDEVSSFELNRTLFDRFKEDKIRKRLLSTIGYHSNSRKVVPFLVKVLKGNYSDTLRRRSANELGDQDDPSVVKFLLEAAKKDYSLAVRRGAVNGLEDLCFSAAVEALIDIAKNANSIYIKRKAVNSLGNIGSPVAVKALKYIVYNDPDLKVKRSAVKAFEDLPRNGGVPYLIEIAREHPIPYIRKKALGSLSDIDDPRVFKVIKSIAMN